MTQRLSALFIGAENAEALTGYSLRWCREKAHALGVPVLAKGRLIPAEAFFAAMMAQTARTTEEQRSDGVDSILRNLGREVA